MRISPAVLSVCLVFTNASLSAQSQGDWKRVEGLPRGEVFAVADDAGVVTTGRVLRADAESILLYAPRVASPQLKPIERLIDHDAHLLEEVDRTAILIAENGILISTAGISKNGTPLAAFDDVFVVVRRARVVTVFQPKTERSSAWGTLAGVAVGGAAGWFSSILIGLHDDGRCFPKCGLRDFEIISARFAGPALGGILGHRLARPKQDLVIYQR